MAQNNPIYESGSLSSTGTSHEPLNTGSTYNTGTTGTTTTGADSGAATGEKAASGVKGVLAGIHGVGEKIRGEFNSGVDGAFNDQEGVAKNSAVANSGDQERLTGQFAHGTKNREGAVPADGERRY